MQLTDRIHLVGSGANGFGMTDPYDCHVYLVDGGSELALIDVGAGMGAAQIIENVRVAGFDEAAIRHVLLTHAHGDHAGGAARIRRLAPNAQFVMSPYAANLLRTGDEVGTSLAIAKQMGMYPADYVLEPCEVETELRGDDTLQVGDLTLTAIETPGHADGHLSFLLDHNGTRSLFGGDIVFNRGTVLLQAIHDCRIDKLITSLRRLRSLEIDALFPGHWTFSLTDGQSHIERANLVLDQLLIPPNALYAW